VRTAKLGAGESKGCSIMRSIKTTSGVEIALDGDLLAVLETLYHEVTARKELERSFEDMKREIDHLIDQLTDDERREYLAESIFLNQVKYENDKLESYLRKLGKSAQG
jgi:Zn-dependent M32 family carboxypeptidase